MISKITQTRWWDSRTSPIGTKRMLILKSRAITSNPLCLSTASNSQIYLVSKPRVNIPIKECHSKTMKIVDLELTF